MNNFQEEISVNLKMKAVLIVAVLALGCSAASAQFNFGFLSYTKATQYCDYESFATSAPFAGGIHVLTTCGLPYDAPTVGFKGSIPKPTGQPVFGAVYFLADGVFDAEFVAYSGLQAIWVTRTVASSKKFGWSFYYNFIDTYGEYLGNYGYLDTTLGPAKHGLAGTSKTSFKGAKGLAKGSKNLIQ